MYIYIYWGFWGEGGDWCRVWLNLAGCVRSAPLGCFTSPVMEVYGENPLTCLEKHKLNVKNSWTQIGTATPHRLCCLLLGINGGEAWICPHSLLWNKQLFDLVESPHSHPQTPKTCIITCRGNSVQGLAGGGGQVYTRWCVQTTQSRRARAAGRCSFLL